LLRRRLRMVGTVSTLREGCELGGVGHRESWIARGNGLDDIASGLTLAYPVAHLFGGRDGFRSALVSNAGLVERSQEARVGVGIGVGRGCQTNCRGQCRKHEKRSHGFILVQIDAVFLSFPRTVSQTSVSSCAHFGGRAWGLCPERAAASAARPPVITVSGGGWPLRSVAISSR